MSDVTECTVKELAANETEREVMAISAAVAQCAAVWNLLMMQWNELWKGSLSIQRWLLC